MITPRITLTSKGQSPVPAELRSQLGLKVHDQLTASIADGGIFLKPDELTLEDVMGSLPPPPGLETGNFRGDY